MWCRLTGRVWRTIEEVLGREAQGIARGLGRGPSDGEPGDAGLATCFFESALCPPRLSPVCPLVCCPRRTRVSLGHAGLCYPL